MLRISSRRLPTAAADVAYRQHSVYFSPKTFKLLDHEVTCFKSVALNIQTEAITARQGEVITVPIKAEQGTEVSTNVPRLSQSVRLERTQACVGGSGGYMSLAALFSQQLSQTERKRVSLCVMWGQ